MHLIIRDLQELHSGRIVIDTLKAELNRADILTGKQEAELTSAYQALNFAQAGSKEWQTRYENQKKLTKEEKKGKRKLIAGLGIAIGVIILETIAFAGG